ncbi:hypothetical protein K2X14_02020 [Acetobacter sp. TBRC 12305]|uniref:DUF883 domain-containing protein n=1 Tax=Acetobacter garciniae TaxID=2817435 RepID=A0A939HN16_9PROT|nr:hypothetical protein [Acetobacter garciniae]MBO1323929.1 hypothetical protein [Acetobacter garciniae]MBX0343618.1 hypothetical protein [Acetobacter garciniae]
MSADRKVHYVLEEGVGSVQDGVEGLFSRLKSYDALQPHSRCAASEACRDIVIDQPGLALATSAFAGFLAGALLKRRQ